ncbi:MAG: helix-turn-helix domain-containing protein [Bacteroidota bacterium]
MSEIVNIKTIQALQRLAGAPPSEHPLFVITRLEDIPQLPEGYPTKMSYDFYSVGLKRNLNGYVKYGRQSYDFQEGLLGFSAPGQVVAYERDVTIGSTGWMLFFEAEILSGHTLATSIHRFGFFNYEVNEALHLSKKEEEAIDSIFENIYAEYHQPIDHYSKSVVLSNFELLLTYANRFYGRQFITRNDVNTSLLQRFDKEIRHWFKEESLIDTGIPAVTDLARALNVSANYLSDALKTLTGKSTKEHIHFHVIEKAKQKLLATNKSIAEVAYELGFEYPQYFSRLFKEKTGLTPKEFRE